jgi:hypothetical protein
MKSARHLAAIVFAAILLLPSLQNRMSLVAGTSASRVQATSDSAQAASAQDRVAAFKKSLQENQARLKQYEWIETTSTSVKGDVKSKKENRCYYGADGRVQKVPVGAPPAAAAAPQARGLKKKVIENKKEDMAEYMQKAAELIQQYVPPNPDAIQKAKDANKISVKPGDSGRVHLDIRDYLKAGDLLGVDLDTASNQIGGLQVSSYLDSKKDAVTLDVKFAKLDDGSSYPAQSVLDVKAKEVKVNVQNSGYKKTAQ